VFHFARDGNALTVSYPEYQVEVVDEGRECRWQIVSPAGDRLYSYADPASAQAEAKLLNEREASRDSTRLRLRELIRAAPTGRP
jgi:hypothetical protein